MQKVSAPGMFKSICVIVLAALFGTSNSPVKAQLLSPPPQMGTPPDASGRRPGDEQSEAQREMMARMQIKRNEARQQQIVKDTTKLLALAMELKSEVDKTNKDVLSLDVIKKADEIEKLSKSIKEHMKD